MKQEEYIKRRIAEIAINLSIEFYNLPKDIKLTQSRQKESISKVKQLSHWLLVTGIGYSLSDAGFYITRNTTGTVFNSVQRIKADREISTKFRTATDTLRNKFKISIVNDVDTALRDILLEVKKDTILIEEAAKQITRLYGIND